MSLELELQAVPDPAWLLHEFWVLVISQPTLHLLSLALNEPTLSPAPWISSASVGSPRLSTSSVLALPHLGPAHQSLCFHSVPGSFL